MFKLGDKVQVTSKQTEPLANYNNIWFETGMDPYVNNGQIFTIYRISSMGISFKEDHEKFLFPKESLTLHANYKPLTKQEKISIKIKLLWNNSNYVKKYPQQAITA